MSSLPPPRFPPRLAPGDRVALVAPGGAVNPKRVQGAVALLESRGLRVHLRDDITACCRYLAGDDRRRREELLRALGDPEIRAVFLARGGYGSQRLLASLRAEELGAPRAVAGFSDNTALLELLRRAGWAVLHGPHPRADCPGELDAVLGCLGYYGEPARPAFLGLRVWGPGTRDRVVAEVGGGCLSLLASSAGTPWAFRAAGRIVFVEDVNEPVYRLDRMLLQLCASGALEDAAAVVFGKPETFLAPGEDPPHLEDLLAELAGSVPCPVLSGASAGHGTPNLPLPFGPRALLDPERGSLAFVEDLVS
ncbi:MAG: S66 peptidase family protein [Deferrisomatales bacterium]